MSRKHHRHCDEKCCKKCCKKHERPFYYDCECESSFNVLDMIKNAMKAEKKAAKFYRYMMEKSPCESDKELFRSIREDEKKHYRLLQEIYRDLTCKCYCVDDVHVRRPKGFCRAIKTAILQEMQDISDYENLAYFLTDMNHKEVICSIINDEREHAQKLAELYQFFQECACKNQQQEDPCQ